MKSSKGAAKFSLFREFARRSAIAEAQERGELPRTAGDGNSEQERIAKERERKLQEMKNRGLSRQEGWLTKEEEKLWMDSQLDYTKAHKAQYETDQPVTTRSTEDRPPTMSLLNARNPPSDGRVYSSPQKTFSAAVDFDRTSTIVPPTEVMDDDRTNVDISEIRQSYFKNYKVNNNLPIYTQRQTIIQMINAYNIVIIEGSTGCGKTTQVPMYILEDAIFSNRSRSAPIIYVTQPRRIAARSIAERICSEHNWTLGTLVGYQVSLEKETSSDSILVFCTAGVLLQKIIQEKSLKNFTHIVIDEAHERDADTDLLMMMIRKLMRDEKPMFRLIVMSATMDYEKLQKYFSFKTKYGLVSRILPAHIMVTKDRKPNNINYEYLDDLGVSRGIKLELPAFDPLEPDLKDECLNAAAKLLVEVIPQMIADQQYSSTLVFLPGLAEISRMERKLREYPQTRTHLDIFPLHSCLTVEDQLKIFKPCRPGCKKVILATNIAESSITLPDVAFVIDFCLTKNLMKNNLTRFPTLRLSWSTDDKCTQRAGRTGRCCTGFVFRMVPRSFYASFNKFAKPELLTAPLELSALRVKNFNMGEIQALLAIVLDPPEYDEIRSAVLELKQIGALSATYQGKLSSIDGDMTELGRIIASLPIDVRLSKLIVLASIFDVLEDAIVVAACLSTNRTVVRYNFGGFGPDGSRTLSHLESYRSRLNWARGTDSDLFVSLYCYREYKEMKDLRGKNERWLAKWCFDNCIDDRKLQDVDALVGEIQARLKYVNINPNPMKPNMERDENMDHLMLQIAFCAAFYPNYFLTEKLNVDQIQKDFGGLDPTRTVILHNFPIDQVPLYRRQVLNQLEECVDEYDMEYIADCSRALIQIKDGALGPGEGSSRTAEALGQSTYNIIEHSRDIPKAVYLTLKAADNMGVDAIEIREYQERAARERMDFYSDKRSAIREMIKPRLAPSRIKVVVDRPADNQHLIGGTDEEYVKVTDKEYYVEVNFNESQDNADAVELANLEEMELAQGNDVAHDTFKPGHRRIRGPDSPIRMSFRSVLVKSRGYSVEIDHQSVNTILLDPEYEKDRRQMLVAASVTQSTRGKVMARDTTLMPNIRGLPALLSLLFAQYYRLIYNDKMHCIAGAIFGIGWGVDDEPLDRNYEVILGFDVHISPDDMEKINLARSFISELLRFTEINNVGKAVGEMQDKLRDVILSLLRKRRYPIQELDVSMIYYQSEDSNDNLFIKDIHNQPDECLNINRHEVTKPFLPMAEWSRQYSEMDLFTQVRENLDHLRRIDEGESLPRGTRCLVCGNGQTNRFALCGQLFTHLRSTAHLEKVREFEQFEKRLRGE